MITQEELKRRLSYDPATGIFRWLIGNSRNVKAGDIAGWNNGKNARRIRINQDHFLIHRLAWFYSHGTWPQQIDHVNGNRMDNRLVNLRPATNGENQANGGAKRNNKLGIRGVGFKDGRYIVQLRKAGEKVRKSFKTLEAAAAFAKEEHKRLHGQFSIHNRASK